MWFIGDNFTAKSYRAHFKKYVPGPGKDKLFIKENFEFGAFCNSRWGSSQENILVRLQNSLAMAINSNNKTSGIMAKYVIVVLDDDLINYLDYGEEGVTTILGSWIEWISDAFKDLISQRLQQVPSKTKKFPPFVYWVAAPTHKYFTKETNKLRIRFNLALESVIRSKGNDRMRFMKIRDGWDANDSKLIINNRISELGLTEYWAAIDASFKYNSQRREIFIAKQLSHPNQGTNQSFKNEEDEKSSLNHTSAEHNRGHDWVGTSVVQQYSDRDPMRRFFDRYAKNDYVEFQRETREDQHEDRFGYRHFRDDSRRRFD